MGNESHRRPIDDDVEDALQRIMETTHNLQRRIFRLSRRNFITPVSVGEMRYHAESIARDVADLEAKVAQNEG